MQIVWKRGEKGIKKKHVRWVVLYRNVWLFYDVFEFFFLTSFPDPCVPSSRLLPLFT